jgi:hypothetical protein
MAITSDNLNLNLNLNLGATAAANSVLGYGGPRYNTEDFPKLNPPNFPANLALPTPYPADWDPELRTWAYVREFITAAAWPTANDPVTSVYTQLLASALFVPPTVTQPPGGPYGAAANPLTTAELAHQVIIVLDASIDRADRALEIVDQATGPGALHYWTGMMRIDPSKDKNTFLLMMVALKIGEFVAMGLKDIFKMRRPAQVYPLIMPLIDGPDTPSFPSSHSTQAHWEFRRRRRRPSGTPGKPWIGLPVASPTIARSPAFTTAWTATPAPLLPAGAWPCSLACPAAACSASWSPRRHPSCRTCPSSSIVPRWGGTDAWSRTRRR